MSKEPLSEFVRRVQATIRQRRMLANGDRVLVAVSGGPDSTALLQALCELAPSCGYEIEATHFNHRLRGDASDRDALLVQERCTHLGVRCHVERAIAAEVSSNIEENARQARYRFCYGRPGNAAARESPPGTRATIRPRPF